MTEPDRISTRAQRGRSLIQLLDERMATILASYCDTLRYDQRGGAVGEPSRAVAWRLGNQEFLFTYHEVPTAPGVAAFRARTQPATDGPLGDWQELDTLGQLDDALRAARRERTLTEADKRAALGAKQHDGPVPTHLILVGLTGSHAYGLQHEGRTDAATGQAWLPSDVDTRAVFVLPTVQVLGLVKPPDLVEQRTSDTTYDEIERFLGLCLKGNPERLEMLAAPKQLVTPEGQLLIDHQQAFLSKQLIQTYGGYARQQLYRIERTAKRATKPAMHLIRLMLTGIRILEEGVVNPDMTAHREALLGIRFGEMPLPEVFRWYESLEAQFARAAARTRLPDGPDEQVANRILLAIRRRYLDWGEANDLAMLT